METKKDFYDKELYRLLDYYTWEKYVQLLLSKKITRKDIKFLICDKNWLIKWKDLRGYDQIKDKLEKINEYKDNKLKNKLKEEIIQFFIKHEKEKNINDIGKMNNAKLLKKDKNGNVIDYFEEEESFEVVEESHTRNLTKVMDREINCFQSSRWN